MIREAELSCLDIAPLNVVPDVGGLFGSIRKESYCFVQRLRECGSGLILAVGKEPRKDDMGGSN